MPIYGRVCKKCDHVWDHLVLSFASMEKEEKKGIRCPECKSKKTSRNFDLKTANPLPKRYGVYTYE